MLRLEYRSKLLNPKWAKTMAAQGSGGAYEVRTAPSLVDNAALCRCGTNAVDATRFRYDTVSMRH